MLERERVARVLAMIGSSHDGEALNAARLAHQLITAAGLTWEEFLAQRENLATEAAQRLLAENEELREQNKRLRARATPQLPSEWTLPSTVAAQIEQAVEWTAVLNDWERKFVTDIAGRSRLSPKQLESLNRITVKIQAIARGRGIA
jgi:hypothetical protein